jgi:uncharacterized protein YkwD
MVTALFIATLLPGSAAGGTGCYSYTRNEKRLARKTNAVRDRLGLRRLRMDPELAWVAKQHTKEMVRKARLFHSDANELTRKVTHWTVLGENVGRATGVDVMQDAFLASPTHKANIVYRGYRNIGIGTKVYKGRVYATVLFQGSDNPGTTLNMPC